MLGGSGDGGDDQADRPLAGEASKPDPSPKARGDLPGSTEHAADGVLDVAAVSLDGSDGKIAVLRKGSLRIGTAEEVANDKGAEEKLDPSCHNLSTSSAGVAVACQGALVEYSAAGEKTREVSVDGLASSGTFAQDGNGVAGVEGSERAYFFNDKGEQTKDVVVTSNTDESLLINTGADSPQRAAIIDRSQTSINDVSIDDQAVNAALRIGQGVGEAAQGRGEDGVIVASDHRQQQMQIFTMMDVVRQHQAAPTGPSPWAVRWDSERHIAWVSTTGDNKLTGYRIDSGTPLPVAELDTIADVRNVIDTPDGTLLLINEAGEFQSLSKADIEKSLQRGVETPEKFETSLVGGTNE